MIYIDYTSFAGGTNNITVATDIKTGLFATSKNGEKAAIANLRRRLRNYYNSINQNWN